MKPYPLCLSNILKDFRLSNMKKTRLKENVNVVSLDYDPINASDVLDIQMLFIKET